MATSWSNESKSGETRTKQLLLIGDGYNLLIDSTYKLEIQSEGAGIIWTNETKN